MPRSARNLESRSVRRPSCCDALLFFACPRLTSLSFSRSPAAPSFRLILLQPKETTVFLLSVRLHQPLARHSFCITLLSIPTLLASPFPAAACLKHRRWCSPSVRPTCLLPQITSPERERERERERDRENAGNLPRSFSPLFHSFVSPPLSTEHENWPPRNFTSTTYLLTYLLTCVHVLGVSRGSFYGDCYLGGWTNEREREEGNGFYSVREANCSSGPIYTKGARRMLG